MLLRILSYYRSVMFDGNLKFVLCLLLAWLCGSILFAGAPGAVASVGGECVASEDYNAFFCGDWTKPEINELMSGLIGDGEIYKIVKENENLYLLYTCEEKSRENYCIRGYVNVIERKDGKMVFRPEGWDWFSP